ncbi:hypothetical protein H7F36_14850 [Variovorax sp. PAMC28562]|uniref:hypothetical protein n=1 Tax=Variovorax sp. PAMC28562 TaxID=2762323 RepID=UPI00164ED94B|nr:hypothetical protein [Variovorax sp. PAMC28562]QNK72492.1 hypothetical protein H7F36_14850 [Variovorax sp. PAMC28562]
MVARKESEPGPTTNQNRTTSERKSDRELVITRSFDAPARLPRRPWRSTASTSK